MALKIPPVVGAGATRASALTWGGRQFHLGEAEAQEVWRHLQEVPLKRPVVEAEDGSKPLLKGFLELLHTMNSGKGDFTAPLARQGHVHVI